MTAAATPTLARVIRGAADALLALRAELDGDAAVALLASVGLGCDEPPAALRALEPRLDAIAGELDRLDAALAGGDAAAILAATLTLGGAVGTAGSALIDLELQEPAVRVEVDGALALAGRRLFDRLLARGLGHGQPGVTAALQLAGVLDQVLLEGPSPPPDETLDEPATPPFLAFGDELRTERLELVATDAGGLARTLYRLGEPDFDAALLLDRLDRLARRAGFSGRSRPGGERLELAFLQQAGPAGPLDLVADIAPTADGALVASLRSSGSLDAIPLGGFELSVSGAVDGVALELRPGAAPVLTTPPAAPAVVSLRSDAAGGVAILRQAGPLSATASAWWLECELAPATPVTVRAGLDGLELALDLGVADALLRQLFGGTSVVLDLAASWSAEDGFALTGGLAGLSITRTLELRLGPLTIHSATVQADVSPTEVTVRALADLSAELVVLTLSAADLGAELTARLADGAGNAGAIELDPPRLVPPTGLGIAVEAGVASGGGFLQLDPDAGEYAGVFDLQVVSVGVSAVGLIDTDAPGVDGWSLFLALFLDLPSIQLGFGFTLTGVGGLVGLNRTLDAEALGAAVRSGSLDAVLFPPDPVADAPHVIETVGALFPPAGGQFVFGPVLRLGWGTPSLVEATIGVVISLPDPVIIAVLGLLESVLPTEEADLVALRLDVAGVADLGAATLSIDASLHDSHVAGFALSGDMALRAGFGAAPTLLMALGGFHPGFDPPPGFPALRRLAVALEAPAISVQLSCYVALTSNTVQFGAALDLSAEIAGFGIEGGTEFDALIGFDPFMLTTHLGFHITVKAAGVDLAGVWLEVDVDGPNPWHVRGEARFKLLGLEEEITVDERIGSRRAEEEIAPADLHARLVGALSAEEAWTTRPAPSPGVTLGGTATPPEALVAVSQGAVPLDVVLDKAGEAPVGDFDVFHLEPGARSLETTGERLEWFAPGEFFVLGPGESLAAPSFEALPAGLEFGGGEAIAGPARAATLEFEQILRDPELDEEGAALDPFAPLLDLRPLVAAAGAAAGPAGGFTIAAEKDPAGVAAPAYVLIDGETGAVRARAATWASVHQLRGVDGVIAPAWETAA